MIKKYIFSMMLASFFMSPTASATVINGLVTGGSAQNDGGVFELIDPIPSGYAVGSDNQQSPNLFAFNEDQNITITSELVVNIGTNPQAGQVVASHYIFFDPANSRRIIGWVDFDADIYGIITEKLDLVASDGLINNSVTYNSPTLRGLESNDSASFAGNRLTINFIANSPGDYIRVLTMRSPRADVPEPSIFGLLGLGLFGIFALRRRKTA